jgi:hypothetical protein
MITKLNLEDHFETPLVLIICLFFFKTLSLLHENFNHPAEGQQPLDQKK